MSPIPAIVYCATCLDSTRGKTAHGLIRFTERFDVRAVVDHVFAGRDAGAFLDGTPNGIPIIASLREALGRLPEGRAAFVVGLATDGGVLPDHARVAVGEAIRAGLDIYCGLHVFLAEDPEFAALAKVHGVQLIDVRKPPHRSELHFYEGKVEEVEAVRVLVLGTDSASGKRTTSWVLRNDLRRKGYASEMIGTGQTAWMQGARFSIRLDTLVNDFVAGEIEHIVRKAWHEARPDMVVVEGQGALLHPAYPGGLELVAAVKPDVLLLQDVPARKTFDGFPDLPMPPMQRQIQALELLTDRKVDALTINPKGLSAAESAAVCARYEADFARPAVDIFREGTDRILSIIEGRLRTREAIG
ncbi:MAG: DUF1611 domain-containing protein [Bacteroidetes bacterium]|nr:DUF1611 domain-containing protein [Bacteroidota bacterium]MDA0875013.1 DUF1611 domain-containing protein [Bacteroidota bacterium]